MNATALVQLEAVIDRDARTAIRCLAAAERATEEGRLNLAKVLRATALAARTRALSMERIAQSDAAALDAWTVVNEADGASVAALTRIANEDARLSRQLATSAALTDIHLRTVKALELDRDVSERAVSQFLFGCEDCGYIAEGSRPELCPACGSVARDWALFAPFYSATTEHILRRQPGEIVQMLRGDSAKFRAALKAKAEDALVQRPEPEEWCVKEIAGHMIDIAELFARRLRALLEPQFDAPEATILPWTILDGQDYPLKTVDDLTMRFDLAVNDGLTLIGRLSAADWRRKADMLSGRVAVIDMASWLANHNVAHIQQIHARLA